MTTEEVRFPPNYFGHGNTSNPANLHNHRQIDSEEYQEAHRQQLNNRRGRRHSMFGGGNGYISRSLVVGQLLQRELQDARNELRNQRTQTLISRIAGGESFHENSGYDNEDLFGDYY